jgi:hypothetical protein
VSNNWLSRIESNTSINESALKQLDLEIQELLSKTSFDFHVPTTKSKKFVEGSESSSGWIEHSESRYSSIISTANLNHQSNSASQSGRPDFLVTHAINEKKKGCIESLEVPVSSVQDCHPVIQVPCSHPESSTMAMARSMTQRNDNMKSDCRCLLM